MHRYIIIVLLTCSIQTHAQNRPIEKYKPISFGSIKPSGWLKTQMQNDLDGFVGNLDKLVPELINDPIYSSGRLHKNSAAKELGNLKDGDAAVGNHVKVKVVKNKVAPPFRAAEFDIIFGEGISKLGEIIDMGVELGIVQKSGSWFSYDTNKLGQGRESVKTLLHDNPELANEIEAKIRAKVIEARTAAAEA